MKQATHRATGNEANKEALYLTVGETGNGELIKNVLTLDGFREELRFTPWRLLRLMKTNKVLSAILEQYAAQPGFWYYMCVYAFPDVVMLLDIHERQYGRPQDSMYNLRLRGAERPSDYTHYVTGSLFMDYRIGDIWNGRIQALYGRPGRRGFAFSLLDRSFTLQETLDHCVNNRHFARQVANCMKMLYPCGVPPAQYCFLSQIEMRGIVIEAIDILERYDTDAAHLNSTRSNKAWDFIFRLHSDYTLYKVTNELDFTLRFLPLDKLLPLLPEREGSEEIAASGLGPWQGWSYGTVRSKIPADAYTGEVLDLHSLVHDLQILIGIVSMNGNRGPGHKNFLDELRRLYVRTVEERLIYEEFLPLDTAEQVARLAAEEFGMIDSSWDPLVLQPESIERILSRRREIEARYGRFDPLYWDLLQSGERSAASNFDNEEWRRVIVGQIDWVKKYQPQGTEEYENITSSCADVTTNMAFPCNGCGELTSEIDMLSALPYCSERCYQSLSTK